MATLPFSTETAWTLLSGDGERNVYAAFRDAAGNETAELSASVTVDETPPTGTRVTVAEGAEVIKLIARLEGVRWVGALRVIDKVDASLQLKDATWAYDTQSDLAAMYVVLHKDVSVQQGEGLLARYGQVKSFAASSLFLQSLVFLLNNSGGMKNTSWCGFQNNVSSLGRGPFPVGTLAFPLGAIFIHEESI
jgi:hypothetical protein